LVGDSKAVCEWIGARKPLTLTFAIALNGPRFQIMMVVESAEVISAVRVASFKGRYANVNMETVDVCARPYRRVPFGK
jgi:hypothetical protein